MLQVKVHIYKRRKRGVSKDSNLSNSPQNAACFDLLFTFSSQTCKYLVYMNNNTEVAALYKFVFINKTQLCSLQNRSI